MHTQFANSIFTSNDLRPAQLLLDWVGVVVQQHPSVIVLHMSQADIHLHMLTVSYSPYWESS